MQAPTRPDRGSAGPDPQASTCTGCGAENASSSSFCWRCFRAFEALAAPAATVPSRREAAEPGLLGERASTRPSSLRWLTAIVVSLAAIAAVSYLSLRGSGTTSFPDSFAGLARIESAQTDLAAQVFRSSSETEGMDADMAFYGSEVDPVAALMWIRGAEAAPGGPDDAFEAFAAGFASGNNGSVATSLRVERTVDGIRYVCAPVTGALPAGLCMWEEDDVFWVLLDVRPGGVSGVEELAVAARNASA